MTIRTRAAEDASEEVQDQDRSEDRQPDTVEVDGEQVPLSELIHTHRERSSWRSSLKEQSKLLSEVAKGATAAAEAARSAPRRAAPEPERPDIPAAVIDLVAEISALPDPAEFPAENKAGMAKLMQKNNAALLAQARELIREEQAGQSQRLRQETHETVQGQSEADRVVQQNVRLLDDVLADQLPGITTSQRDAVAKKLKGLTGEEYGEVITLPDRNRVIRYNREAVLAAFKLSELKPAPRRASSTRETATEDSRELGDPPAQTAPAKSHIDWLRRAAKIGGEEAEAAQKYFEALPIKKRSEIHAAHKAGG